MERSIVPSSPRSARRRAPVSNSSHPLLTERLASVSLDMIALIGSDWIAGLVRRRSRDTETRLEHHHIPLRLHTDRQAKQEREKLVADGEANMVAKRLHENRRRTRDMLMHWILC